MPLILNIDTATSYGAAGLSADGTIIAFKESGSQMEHASFLQPAIAQLMREAGRLLKDIDAVAVTIGPGSYTGLRVGLASAKGLCYALGKPLLTVNTLQVMALASVEEYLSGLPQILLAPLFCPMIDARRMEVFTALYNLDGGEVMAPQALIIDENIFASKLQQHQIICSGNGAFKVKAFITNPSITILSCQHRIHQLAVLALAKYQLHRFSDIAYCEPLYLKAFHTFSKK